MAEKEANLARQEEERAEQRRKGKADKKAQKKTQKGIRVGEKRTAEQDDYHSEWNEDLGKYSLLVPKYFIFLDLIYISANQNKLPKGTEEMVIR